MNYLLNYQIDASQRMTITIPTELDKVSSLETTICLENTRQKAQDLQLISSSLYQLEIFPTLEGYPYLLEIITYLLEYQQDTSHLNEIYTSIANKFRTTTHEIEIAIYHLMEESLKSLPTEHSNYTHSILSSYIRQGKKFDIDDYLDAILTFIQQKQACIGHKTREYSKVKVPSQVI